jgi:hypothetical protein
MANSLPFHAGTRLVLCPERGQNERTQIGKLDTHPELKIRG